MGPGLDDGYADVSDGTDVMTSEWRTTPLWGLGLQHESQGGSLHLLHDGRAKSIGEAIVDHGGEAENAKSKYINLSTTEKEKLEKFILSL